MTIDGADITTATPRQVADIGVAHIPEDRGRDELIDYMTVSENCILDCITVRRTARASRRSEAIRMGARDGVRDFDIRTPSIHTLAGSLSGGNQRRSSSPASSPAR